MQLTAKQRDELRARLASRKSVFGGSLSTASASAASTYIPAKARFQPEEPKVKKTKTVNDSQHAPRQEGAYRHLQDQPAKKLKAAPTDYSAFEALLGNTPPPEKKKAVVTAQPKGQPARNCLPPGANGKSKAAGAPAQHQDGKPAGGCHVVLPAPSLARNPFQYQKAPTGNTPPPQRQVKKSPKARNKQAKHAARLKAVAPQAVGGPTRSQKATQAWASQLAIMRTASPSVAPKSEAPCASGRAPDKPQSSSKGPPCRDNPPAAKQMQTGRQMPAARKQQPSASTVPPLQRAQPPQERKRLNLAGKDLSKLPEWQRQILERKFKEEMRWKRRREEEEEESDSDLDDFVVDDNEGDWRNELKSITGYDPSRFKDEKFDDRSMEADWKTIQAEEKRSSRMGRSEDEKAELEELARLKAKAAKKKSKMSSGFLLG